jgi:hypothetical protein
MCAPKLAPPMELARDWREDFSSPAASMTPCVCV